MAGIVTKLFKDGNGNSWLNRMLSMTGDDAGGAALNGVTTLVDADGNPLTFGDKTDVRIPPSLITCEAIVWAAGVDYTAPQQCFAVDRFDTTGIDVGGMSAVVLGVAGNATGLGFVAEQTLDATGQTGWDKTFGRRVGTTNTTTIYAVTGSRIRFRLASLASGTIQPFVQLTPFTSVENRAVGYQTHVVPSTAGPNFHTIFPSNATLMGYDLYNRGDVDVYVRLYNQKTFPAVAGGLVTGGPLLQYTISVPAGKTARADLGKGIDFNQGFVMGLMTGYDPTDATGAGASQIIGNINYVA